MFDTGLYGGSNRIKLDKPGYFKAGIGVAIIFGLIILYGFEIKHFDLVLNPKLLFAYAFGFGLVLGVLLGNRFSRGTSEAFEKMRIYMILITLCIIFMPLLVNLANRLLDFRTPELKEVSFENVEAYISEKYGILKGEDVKIAGYRIILVMDQEVLQLKSKHNPFPNNKKGDKVQIAIHKGLFGIKFVSLKAS
jgi:hypothetical protein